MRPVAYGLTAIQRDALLIIQELTAANGAPPTRQELADELGLANRSGAQRIVDHLIARGHLARQTHKARTLTVLQPIPMPEEPEIEITPAGRAYVEGVAA